MKKLSIILLMVTLSFGVTFAQINSTAKSFRSYNADSLTVQTELTGLRLMYDSAASFYYNVQSGKWRIWELGQWRDILGSGGGGGSYTSNNGITLTGTNFQLGGALSQSTEIGGGGSYLPHANFYPSTNNSSFGIFGAGTDYATLSFNKSSAANGAIALGVSNGGGILSILSITNSGFNFLGKSFFNPSATLSGYNVGSLSGDPSSLINGDIWYNSTSNALRARINGVSVSLGAGGGGITNTAANNEMAKSDGTNLVPSGVFVTNTSGAVSAITNGIDPDVDLNIDTKGDGNIILTSSLTNFTAVTIADGSIVMAANNSGTETSGITISNSGVALAVSSGTGDITLSADPGAGRYILIPTLPTTNPGVANSVWNNNGNLVMSGSTSFTPFMQSRDINSADNIDNADNFFTIYLDSATPFNLTIDQMTINSQVYLINIGAGTVTFVNGAGVTYSGLNTLIADQSASIVYRSATAPIIR